jgi:hypothetical protein
MLYTIEILPRWNNSYQIISGYDRLFDILMILDKSPDVWQFKVSSGAMTNASPNLFGWGKFDKWVNKFTYINREGSK